MATYEVFGLALAHVEVRHTVEASTEKEAMKIAKERFKAGDCGLVSYSDDDESTVDYKAINAGASPHA